MHTQETDRETDVAQLKAQVERQRDSIGYLLTVVDALRERIDLVEDELRLPTGWTSIAVLSASITVPVTLAVVAAMLWILT